MILKQTMMIMAIHYKKSLLLIVAALLTFSLAAQEKVSKKIQKSYEMTRAGELYLSNKYGNITINGWNKNSISIEIDISVTHKKRDNAENLLGRIVPEIREMDDFITITSVITEKSTNIFAKYFNKANPFDFDKSNVQIDYTVYLPKNAELEIINTFGDIVIEDWIGKLKADVQHGDIWINKNLNNADVSLKYGKLKARSINYGNIRLKNGSMDMERSRDLRINSSGSDIEVEEVTSLEIYSSKDEIVIEEVEALNGDLEFTNMLLNNVDDVIDLTMKISDFRVSNIHSSDASITIYQESSEVSLNIEGFSFEFDATLEEGLLRLPKSFKNVNTKMIDKGKRVREIKASYGKDTSGKISITGKKGVILLKEF